LIFPPLFFFKLDISDKLYQLGFLLALLGTVLPPFLFSVGIPRIGISLSAILSAAADNYRQCYFLLRDLDMKDKFLGSLLVLLGACSFGVLSSIVKTAYQDGYKLGEVTGIQCFLGMLMLWSIHFIVDN